jgi:hypothetical protein
MDFRINNREKRFSVDGAGEVMLDNSCELYPIFDEEDDNLIVDVEVVDGETAELLDRAAFAMVKQRGMDPIDPNDGVQWAEYSIGEVSAPVILAQIASAVGAEGPGVKVDTGSVYMNGEQYASFTVKPAW